MNRELRQALAKIEDAPRGKAIAAFFDFDGTLIDGYSAAAYFTSRLRSGEMGARELFDTLRLARRGPLTDAEFADLIGKGVRDWAGESEDEMRALWQRLFVEKIGSLMFPEAWHLVRAHQRCGHTVVIASSATPYQIEPLAREYDIAHVLATRPRVRNGRLTGSIVGAPLWGDGKAAAVRSFAEKHDIALDQSFAYANGDEDRAFLGVTGRPAAINPKPLLLRHAQDQHWPVLHFDPRRRAPPRAVARTVGAYGAMGLTFLAGLGLARFTGNQRRAVDFIAATSSDAALAILGIDVEVRGEEHLWAHRPCVFIVNHQSKFDMYLMMYLVRRGFTGVAKAEAANTPGFKTFLKMADMAFVERGHSNQAIEALSQAVERLQRGLCVAIAPEGTRSYSPRIGAFKKGAFHMAHQARVPVVPVVFRNTGEVMGRNDQMMRAGTVQVAVLPPVQVVHWKVKDFGANVEAVRQDMIATLENWPT
ncbi:HAD-IB family hydrolase [Solimonas terrae]|uniref:1-acyl-sn-glycerol-3-phosphate acyltransferase n=1 Tax=Solimonas terrae TaxID=1396819 RepID=A0A6M2BWA6_9GAMM|nr:HAD-IB family hydrolase [Solimonas terrae]NGY06778.1 HAD-IB family hydrolase [Solimonas terrae]